MGHLPGRQLLPNKCPPCGGAVVMRFCYTCGNLFPPVQLGTERLKAAIHPGSPYGRPTQELADLPGQLIGCPDCSRSARGG